nr:hypothetical protein [Tanacetum cinerariifolium]
MVLIPYSNIWSYPKVVSPHSGHGSLTHRRYPGVRDTVQLETAVNTISYEYLLEFTSEYGIPETLHPALPGPEDRIVDFPEGKIGVYTRFFEFANFRFTLSQFLFDVLGYYQIHLSQLSVIDAAKVSHFEINCRVLDVIPTLSLLCVFYTPSFNSGWMSFSKRPGRNTPQCYTKPLDSLKNWNNRFFWADERVFPTVVDWRTNAPKDGMPAEGTFSLEATWVLDTHRTSIQKQPEMLLCLVGISHMDLFNLIRAPNPTKAGASDQGTAALEMPSSEDVPATAVPGAGGSHGGKSLAAIQLGLASAVVVPEDAHVGVSDPDPLSYADAPSRHPVDVAQSFPGIAAAGDPKSENASSPAEVRSPGSVYQPEWGVTNGSLLDTPEACQDLVDHVAMGSQLRLRFEQEAKLLRKSVGQVARRDKRIQARELEIRNMEASLEAEANAKRAAEDKSAGLSQELERMRAQFSDLQIYPHMLTAIACRRWVIGRGLRLAVMKCGESLELRQAFVDAVSAGIAKGLSEGLRHGLEHGQAQRSLESIEAYDPEAKAKFVAALQALKDLKYPLVDQLEGLRNAPMDVIMVALDWTADAIAANISRAEKKKRSHIVCRTHGVGSAHHARSDGVPVSAPTVVPQGLALLLVDAATQTESDGT